MTVAREEKQRPNCINLHRRTGCTFIDLSAGRVVAVRTDATRVPSEDGPSSAMRPLGPQHRSRHVRLPATSVGFKPISCQLIWGVHLARPTVSAAYLNSGHVRRPGVLYAQHRRRPRRDAVLGAQNEQAIHENGFQPGLFPFRSQHGEHVASNTCNALRDAQGHCQVSLS